MRARLHTIPTAVLAFILVFCIDVRAQETPAAQETTASEPVKPATAPAPLPATTQLLAPPLDPAAEAAAAISPDESAEASVETPVASLPNSKALEESGLSNQKGHDEYTRPLLFAPEDNGMQPENPQIRWDMDAAGNKINLGGLKLDAASFGIKIDQVRRSRAPNDIRASAQGPESVVDFSFSWPALMITTGVVSIETIDGKATWTSPVTEASRAEWRKKLLRYKDSLLKVHVGALWGFTDLPSSVLKSFRGGTPFRVCLSQDNSEFEKLKACSRSYNFQQVGKGRQVVPAGATVTPDVSLNGKSIGSHGLINLPLKKKVEFKISFADTSSILFSSQPAALSLIDVVTSKDGKEIILTGRAAEPLGKKKILSRPETHFWASSGIAEDTVWQIALPIETPTLRILGAFNVPFTFLFRYEKLPKEADRVYIHEGASTGTYSAHPIMLGFSRKTATITSDEDFATKIDDYHFEWHFAAPQIGERNRAKISIVGTNDHPSTWVAHHQLYRGFPFEASARLSGVLGGSGQLILLGEVAGAAWFESLGFTQSEIFSRQRWGLTARYFKALTAIESSTGKTVSDFGAATADLRYNISRGIWNRDQLFGVMGSMERVTIAGLTGTLAGGGVYWARTLPRIFADLFDKFPLLDYSKYVDMDFAVYPVSLSSDVNAGTSFNLNFHGKVFWTPRVYGEAGFGMRYFKFAVVSQNADLKFASAYGNIGMGLIF